MKYCPIYSYIMISSLRFKVWPLFCSFDHISIYDTVSATTSSHCGSSVPAARTVAGDNVVFEFKTDGSGTGTGFKLDYSTASYSCGGGPMAGPTGIIGSPGHPGSHGNNLNCQWVITATEPLTFEYSTFELETWYVYAYAQCARHQKPGLAFLLAVLAGFIWRRTIQLMTNCY